jgi:predicted O-methyltransferase YrrM
MSGKEIWQRWANIPWLFSQARDVLLDARNLLSKEEFAQLYRKVRPYTVCGNARLRGLYSAVQYVVAQNIPGDLVECGTARGGSAALMGLTLKRLDANRRLWVFDTFEGLPPPTEADPDYETAKLYTGRYRVNTNEVQTLFEQLGILSQCRLIKGLFQETLPTCGLEKISVLHLDGDWYESLKVCLNQLYDRVSPGGVIHIDDYGHWKGARKAVDEFLRQRSINVHLRWLDYTGRQFIKPS